MVRVLKRKAIKNVALFMAGFLLFAQAVVAAQACTLTKPMAVHLLNSDDPANDCEGVLLGKRLCLAHCVNADRASQAVDLHFLAVAPPVTEVVSPVPSWPDVRAPVSFSTVSAVGPPLQILFCSYQT